MRSLFTLFIAFTSIVCTQAQSTLQFADSIRKAYKIPELGYAVLSSAQVIELQTLGVKKINSLLAAAPEDRFRLGSNTKAITGFIAAQLVRQNKISWNTKFFDLYPELKAKSNRAYHHLTLLDLLTFRTRFYPYTYTYEKPAKGQFTGSNEEQRYQFTQWFFTQKPVKKKAVNFSNLGYVAAGLMLEKASGGTYNQLVGDLGNQIEISFGFGPPNYTDTLQPWGHDETLTPEPPGDNYKLNWLQAAGNVNASLPGYTKFIQLQLQGLKGQSPLLSKEEFRFLHYGLPTFAVGWFWQTDTNNHIISYNIGNPGSFLSKVYVHADLDIAFILFANAQTPEADAALNILYEELKMRYMR